MIKETIPLEVQSTGEEFYNPNKSWLDQYDARNWFMKYGKINELLNKYEFSVIDVKGIFYLYSQKKGIKLTFDSCYLNLTKQIIEENAGTHKLGVVYLSRGIVVDRELTGGFRGSITVPIILDGTLTQEEFFPFIEKAMKDLEGSKLLFR